MNPQIFIGLGTPKSQLYFDIQAMIAKNGGRLRLADRLEAELNYAPCGLLHSGCKSPYSWTNYEINYIKFNYENMSCKEIANELGRPFKEILYKIYDLQKNAELPYKKPQKKNCLTF